MTDEERDLREQLKAFGLSDKEVDTYVTLLGHGEAKASVIAEDAGVSKRYVYNVLGEFEDRGFVEINDHERPTTVRAVEPSVVIDRFATQLDSMEERLQARYDPEPKTDRRYEVIKSTSTVRKRIQQLLADAEEEVNIAVPAAIVPDIADELRAAVDRGVLTVLQVHEDGSDAVDEGDLAGLGSVVRRWRGTGPILITVDRKHGLFSPTSIVRGSETDEQAISFTEERLSPVVVGSFLGNYWPDAEEVHVKEPTELPNAYTRFRHAVLDATLHRRRGERVVAELEIRRTEGDDPFDTVRAEITGVRQGLVEPTNNTIPIEHALTIDDGTDTFSVGGPGAFKEDYEARRVKLDSVDDPEPSVSELIERSAKLDSTEG